MRGVAVHHAEADGRTEDSVLVSIFLHRRVTAVGTVTMTVITVVTVIAVVAVIDVCLHKQGSHSQYR